MIFKAAFLPLQASKYSNLKISSLSKQFSFTKIQSFSFREEKCSSVCSYDKNIGTFWQKRTFKEDSETEEVVSARFDEFFEEEHEEEGVGPETIPPAEPISVEVIIAIDEKGIIILHSLTPISTLMHSQAAPQWG